MGGGASLPTLQAEKVKWVMSTPAFKDLPEDKLESVVQKVSVGGNVEANLSFILLFFASRC